MKNEVLSLGRQTHRDGPAGKPMKLSRELVQKHSGKIYGVSLRMLKNREDVEDNVQNVLVKAYYNIGRFEGQSTVFHLAVSHHHQRSTPEITPP